MYIKMRSIINTITITVLISGERAGRARSHSVPFFLQSMPDHLLFHLKCHLPGKACPDDTSTLTIQCSLSPPPG